MCEASPPYQQGRENVGRRARGAVRVCVWGGRSCEPLGRGVGTEGYISHLEISPFRFAQHTQREFRHRSPVRPLHVHPDRRTRPAAAFRLQPRRPGLARVGSAQGCAGSAGARRAIAPPRAAAAGSLPAVAVPIRRAGDKGAPPVVGAGHDCDAHPARV
eukprot:scaffold13983_cov125-Isochrysis_galbana.AAC.1